MDFRHIFSRFAICSTKREVLSPSVSSSLSLSWMMETDSPTGPSSFVKDWGRGRPLSPWKEHRDACERGMMEKSAVVELAWETTTTRSTGNLETTALDHGRRLELLVKEALHIQMTPAEECFNQDGGLEVPGWWTVVMRRQGGKSNPHRPLNSNDVYPQ